jgi:2-phospho-L-lactate guanylyltransferase (CobY/MobA/RfbA family)
MPARFGPESAAAHEATARELGLAPLIWRELPPHAQIDLDTPEDAARLAELAPECRTQSVLRELLK